MMDRNALVAAMQALIARRDKTNDSDEKAKLDAQVKDLSTTITRLALDSLDVSSQRVANRRMPSRRFSEKRSSILSIVLSMPQRENSPRRH